MKIKYVLVIVLCFATCVLAKDVSKYKVLLNPNNRGVEQTVLKEFKETLFILDYSNSMNEMLYNATKYEMLLESMKLLLSNIGSNNRYGIRLYGHRWGLTPLDACRASISVLPIDINNSETVSSVLKKYSPRGMTPITYALKQAVKKDFKKDGDKHIILITDGGENCDESPCKYAMELIKYRKDITIDVIAFNMDNEDDLEQLECVAKVTKGKLYQAETKAELVNSLNNAYRVKKDVDAMIVK